jgi:SAM-dependent methyltransferase
MADSQALTGQQLIRRVRNFPRFVYRTLIRAPFGFGDPSDVLTWDDVWQASGAAPKPAVVTFAKYLLHACHTQGMDRPRILDLGCGAGHFLDALPAGSFRYYTGIDLSPEAIRQARVRCIHAPELTTLLVGDFETYAASGLYDVIVARECLYYARQPGSIIRRFGRSLGESGLWVISMHDSWKNRWLWRALQRQLVPVDRTVLRNDGGQLNDVRILRSRGRIPGHRVEEG